MGFERFVNWRNIAITLIDWSIVRFIGNSCLNRVGPSDFEILQIPSSTY